MSVSDLRAWSCCGDRPLRNHVGSTESEDVDGCEASLSARWDEHHSWFGGRVLHDGVVHWLSHGQQACLSVTHIEALNRTERRKTADQKPRTLIFLPTNPCSCCLADRLQTWMCSSRGTGLTLGWKLNVAVVLQPSQWATSLALDSEELRATMRMGRSI